MSKNNNILLTNISSINNNQCMFCNKKLKYNFVIGYPIIKKYNYKFDYGFMYGKYQKIKPNEINHEEYLKFCDVICAKFYDINIKNIEIDFDLYREKYIEGNLSKTEKVIYEKCMKRDFTILPILHIPNYNSLSQQQIKRLKVNYLNMI
jgi:hypothetical protein